MKRHKSPREKTPTQPTRDQLLDEALKETFPASDPPEITQPAKSDLPPR